MFILVLISMYLFLHGFDTKRHRDFYCYKMCNIKCRLMCIAFSGTDEVMRMIDKMVENLEEEKTSEVGNSGQL